MHASKTPRRSSRIPFSIPILVTSLKPGTHFSEICETMVVNAHGCALRSPTKVETGAPLHFHSKEGRQTMAQVVDCRPLDSSERDWMLAARLDRPENFWGLQSCPEDWVRLLELPNPTQRRLLQKLMSMNAPASRLLEAGASSQATLEQIEKQLSDDHLRTLIAEVVQPLKGVVTSLREKLNSGEQKRSRFEVSLSEIPPDLEEKLWVRLRQDLSPQVLTQTREQSEQILASAREIIERKINDTREEFRKHLAGELQHVEQRLEGVTAGLADSVRQNLRTSLEELQQRTGEAGNRLSRDSENLFRALQEKLEADHDVHCQQMRQIQAEFAAESSRLQAQLADTNNRIERLNDCTRRLESDFDQQLAGMANEAVSSARHQLEQAVEASLEQVGTRSARALETQLDEACGRLKSVQRETENNVADSVNKHIMGALESFEQSVDEVAHHSVGRWRIALAQRLNSLSRILAEQFPLETSEHDA